jgi:hypothetical protein
MLFRYGQRLKVRFDFNGVLIPLGTSLPTHLGLHHHGEQQSAAGYSLSELCLWVRSAVPQQRMLALNTLENIVRRYQ